MIKFSWSLESWIVGFLICRCSAYLLVSLSLIQTDPVYRNLARLEGRSWRVTSYFYFFIGGHMFPMINNAGLASILATNASFNGSSDLSTYTNTFSSLLGLQVVGFIQVTISALIQQQVPSFFPLSQNQYLHIGSR